MTSRGSAPSTTGALAVVGFSVSSSCATTSRHHHSPRFHPPTPPDVKPSFVVRQRSMGSILQARNPSEEASEAPVGWKRTIRTVRWTNPLIEGQSTLPWKRVRNGLLKLFSVFCFACEWMCTYGGWWSCVEDGKVQCFASSPRCCFPQPSGDAGSLVEALEICIAAVSQMTSAAPKNDLNYEIQNEVSCD